MVGIVTDLHDRALPQELGATASVNLDFTESGLSDEDGLRQLGEASDLFELRLVRVAPDLGGDLSGQVFVVMSEADDYPDEIDLFGDQPAARVVDMDALANSYASGQYLVTNGAADEENFRSWLTAHGVEYEWNDDTLGASLRVLVGQASFATTLIAVVALMVSLVLYSLSVKAKGRALRVLAGSPTWRIQYEDLGGFLASILLAAVVCDALAVAYVGAVHGYVFVPYYLTTLLAVNAIVIAVTTVCAVVMSAVSWPSVQMLAAREPGIAVLRPAAHLLKAATFVMVIAVSGPAVSAYTESAEAAAQQSQWKSLSDQVRIAFSGVGGEDEFRELLGSAGALVEDAEQRDAVALSYAWSPDVLAVNEIDVGPYDSLALVNPTWLDLMQIERGVDGGPSEDQTPRLSPLAREEVPQQVAQSLGLDLELWTRGSLGATEALSKVTFYEYTGATTIPMAEAGTEQLVFLDNVLVVVAEGVYELFNDDFLLSLMSTSNLIFDGLGQTQALVVEHGLQDEVDVRYAAEEGVLRAQYTAYFAWLQGFSLASLTLALAVAALVGAFISALLSARRDFPIRLAGHSWTSIIAARVGREWLIGAMLTAVVIGIRGFDGDSILTTATALVTLGLSPLAHLLAVRRSFSNVTRRRL